jgi:hypothetical protein
MRNEKGMNYKVASTLSEVLDAWCLVYNQYLKAALISPNRMSVFTFPEYISNNAAVILGKKMGYTVCTVSALLDSERGLPLDNYYKKELDELRNQGNKLVEIGLLADSRSSSNIQDIVTLMQCTGRFGVFSDHHHFVIGVNPRRINFFKEVFGFKLVGTVKDYGKLKAAPVVLMCTHTANIETIALKAIAPLYDNSTNLNFANRYKFSPDNFINPLEFKDTIEVFIRKIWNSAKLQSA